MFIFQTHLWDDATPIEETLRTLDDLVRCGKVRYTGACNLVGWQMQKVVDLTKYMGFSPMISLQVIVLQICFLLFYHPFSYVIFTCFLPFLFSIIPMTGLTGPQY